MLENIKAKIKLNGGFVNAHSHLDRANTVNSFTNKERYMFLKEKWRLVDKIKKQSTQIDYENRINKALHGQMAFGIKQVCSFIDIDTIVGSKAISAAYNVAQYDWLKGQTSLIIATQTLKGVLNPQENSLLLANIEKTDIIGSLPGADRGRESEHLDFVMNLAKQHNKRLHVHVDQLNTNREKETELLARKTIQWGMENKVTAIHSISLACHPKYYRQEVYSMSRDAGLSFIACPSAWIDHPRREDLAPIHNSITPVDELIENNLTVAIGSDNIHDVYKPYCNGDMMFELRMLLEACKIYDEDELVKIATINGRKVLGYNRR
jgi:cytosine/adenosine deaminase-related metal-dependent hydrolase